MPYREDIVALRCKIEGLRRERAELDEQLGPVELHLRLLEGDALRQNGVRAVVKVATKVGIAIVIFFATCLVCFGGTWRGCIMRSGCVVPKSEIARGNVSAIRSAVYSYVMDDGPSPCPTVLELIETGELDETTDLDDPWGNSYGIWCNDTSVVVASRGEDGEFCTDDDISSSRTPLCGCDVRVQVEARRRVRCDPNPQRPHMAVARPMARVCSLRAKRTRAPVAPVGRSMFGTRRA